MNFPHVSIIFPNYNGKNDALECLSSLLKLDYPKEKLEIIVVDNGSKDGSQAAIKAFIAEHRDIAVRLIENQKNLGAPAAYNIGIRQANPKFQYIWKLDNDVILEKKSLLALAQTMEVNQKMGMCSGKIYYYDKLRDSSPIAARSKNNGFSVRAAAEGQSRELSFIFWAIGGKINYFLGNFRNAAKNQEDRGQYEKLQTDFDFLPGCALLVRRDVIQKIGPLDEKYFVYYDETDWCVRAKQAGFALAYVPSAKIWHKASRTTREGSYFKNYYLTRNKILFLRKFRKSIFFPILFTLGFEIWHRWLFRSRFFDLPNIIKGVGKGIRGGISNF